MEQETMTKDADGRMSFDEALAYAGADKGSAFAVTPVFGDVEDDQATAEGARVFVLLRDTDAIVRLRFVAGPFFSTAYAANEVIDAAEAPDSVRNLRFMPTRCEPAWFSEQVQVLINKLVNASATQAPQMPDYEHAAKRSAAADVVFPLSFIGKPH
jgi:hypothetical protein